MRGCLAELRSPFLAALRAALVQEKRKLHESSVREQSIREGTVGRAVWRLIEQGRLESSVLALIRDDLSPALSSGRAAAFIGTVFEQPMPVTLAEEVGKAEVPVPPAQPDVPAVKRLPTTSFRVPRPPAST